MTLGNCCAVSGTGFLVSAKTIKENDGWKFFTLTEDIEFTFDCVAKDRRIGYAENAIFYDEQPVKLDVSITQRSRWIRGCLQVIGKYCGGIVKKMFKGDMSAFDMFMNTVPMLVCGVFGLSSNALIITHEIFTAPHPEHVLFTLLTILFNSYWCIALFGVLTAITERKRINATNWQIIKSILTFPAFVSTYVIAFLVAVTTDVKWKPIPHNKAVSAKEMKKLTKV